MTSRPRLPRVGVDVREHDCREIDPLDGEVDYPAAALSALEAKT